MASQNVKAHPFRSVINGPALPIIDHLKACPAVELHHMARRAVIGFRGPVLSHRKAGRNLIDGLHREVIDLIKAQLLRFVLVHAPPLPCWMPLRRQVCAALARSSCARGCYEPSDLLMVRAKSPALTHEAGLFCSSQGENLAFPAFAFC